MVSQFEICKNGKPRTGEALVLSLDRLINVVFTLRVNISTHAHEWERRELWITDLSSKWSVITNCVFNEHDFRLPIDTCPVNPSNTSYIIVAGALGAPWGDRSE